VPPGSSEERTTATAGGCLGLPLRQYRGGRGAPGEIAQSTRLARGGSGGRTHVPQAAVRDSARPQRCEKNQREPWRRRPRPRSATGACNVSCACWCRFWLSMGVGTCIRCTYHARVQREAKGDTETKARGEKTSVGNHCAAAGANPELGHSYMQRHAVAPDEASRDRSTSAFTHH